MLLCAVVDVALQPAPLFILGGDDPLAGGPQLRCPLRAFLQPYGQLGAQPDRAQDQTGLCGQAGEQLLLDRRQRLPVALGDHEPAQRLPRMADVEQMASIVDCRRAGSGLAVRRAFGPGRRQQWLAVDDEPDLRVASTGRLGQQPRHPRRDLVRGIPGGHLVEEAGEDLVRRGALATGQPRRDRPQPPAYRLEPERDDRRGEHRQRKARRVGTPDQRSAAAHHHDIDRGDEQRHAEQHQDGRPCIGSPKTPHASQSSRHRPVPIGGQPNRTVRSAPVRRPRRRAPPPPPVARFTTRWCAAGTVGRKALPALTEGANRQRLKEQSR
jgi:hypothetical protein